MIASSCLKESLGRALRMAAELDDRATGIPSTKGMLE
jgi:imidazoleglycerol phosphate dehydratase HisB